MDKLVGPKHGIFAYHSAQCFYTQIPKKARSSNPAKTKDAVKTDANLILNLIVRSC